MVKLVSRSPAAGLLPLSIGEVKITEVTPDCITSVAPFKGQAKPVSEALKSAAGMAFPAPNRITGKQGARAVWSGHEQAFVLGPDVGEIAGAALTDQSDAWTCVALEGADAVTVLSRLVPLDLRESRFKRGHAARTLIGHMTGVVMRTGAQRWEVMVFRSMAGTLVHELENAARGIEARRAP